MLDSAGRRAASHGSGAPGRCDSGHPPASAATHPIRVRGSNSRTTRYTCGRAIRGIFPPVLLEAQVERLAQQAHGKMVMPAGPGASASPRLTVQPHVALLGLKLGFVRHLDPPTWARVSRGGSSGAFWIGSSGVRGRPDSGATLPRPLR